jgi:Nucleotidyltransferase domain
METKEYLEAILAQESLKDDGPELNALREERDKVAKIIENAFSDCKPTVRYGGSKAKGTMVKGGYDLDLTVYFDHDSTACGETLKDIYQNVQNALAADYHVVPKNSSIRLEVLNDDKYTHIDVVPGRFVSDDIANSDVFLHQNEGDKNRLKTNLEKHIQHIKESGVRSEIKLAKVWRNRQGLSVKTFVLELMVVKILEGRKDKSLEENIKYLWEQLRDNADNISIVDPANPDGNDLKPLLDQVRYGLSSAASSALSLVEMDMWSSILGEAESGEKNTSYASTAIGVTAPVMISNPSKPWATSELLCNLTDLLKKN